MNQIQARLLPTPKQRKLKRGGRWVFPAAVEREYERWMRAYSQRVIDAVEAHVIPALKMHLDYGGDSPQTPGWYEAIKRAMIEVIAASSVLDGELLEFARNLFEGVSEFNKKQFQRLLRRSYGVDVIVDDVDIRALMSVWEAENIKLIRSIPQQYATQLHGRIVNAVQEGKRLSDVVAEIKGTYHLPLERAELIARDQIGKLNGQITMVRQKSIGVTEYRWRGSLDERERPEHRAREGAIFQWSDPPEDGHPGQPIRCRCWADAVLPILDDLNALIVH